MVVGLLGNESSDLNRLTLVTPKSENDVRLQATLDNQNPTGLPEGTEKVDYTVYIWYNVSIKYRRCFYDRTTAEIDAKSIHGNI